MKNAQLRKHLHFGIREKWRYRNAQNILGQVGENVFIEKDVDFMRYPGNIFIGNEVVVKSGTRICPCNENAVIKIGNHTTIGHHNFMFASEHIEIGSDCLIAPFVYFVDSDHGSGRGKRINEQPNTTAPIVLEDDIWVGTGAKILKGVRISRGAIIAAGSLVNTSVPEFEIWGGTPARKIGERS